MEQKVLKAYFDPFPLRVALMMAIGAALLVLLIGLAPGTERYQTVHQRVFTVFTSEKMGVDPEPLEVIFTSSYILVLVIIPLILVAGGIAALRSYRRLRASIDDKAADAALKTRMAQLPTLLEKRLGLPPLADGEKLLVLWEPRPEDRELFHPLDRKKRKKLKNVAGRIAVGKDKLVRCARLSVLLLEKRGSKLCILNGFYDLLEQRLSGETWGEYRLENAGLVKEDADFGRLALVMADRKQFIVPLLKGKEGERLSKELAFELIPFEGAGKMLKEYCEIREP